MRAGSLLLAVITGCVSRSVPFTDVDLLDDPKPGRALVFYLAQDGADPLACDSIGRRAELEVRDVKLFVRGLERGGLVPAVWGACAAQLRPRLRPAERAELDLAVARLFRRAVAEARGAQASALLELRAVVDPPVAEDPRIDAEEDRLRALAPPRGTDGQLAAWLELLDMERGRYGGQDVDAALIATLDDELVLTRLADRLPAEELRRACAWRLVALRVAASPFAELHGREDIVDRVLELGRNPVDRDVHPVVAARWTREAPLLWVEQVLPEQRARLLTGPPGALQPPLDLRELIEVELEGISLPVTACGPPSERDPSPCLLLSTDEPWARITDDSVVHLDDEVPMAEAARLGRHLPLALTWGDLAVGEPLSLPVRFALPEPLVFRGGPDLELRVGEVAGRFVWKVQAEDRYLAVVEADEADAFRISTVGTAGRMGSPGIQGTPGIQGLSGSPAMCPSSPGRNGSPGGNGGPGGRGGDGGPGGPGGDVAVALVASGERCDELTALVAEVVISRGGPGGAGGLGGAGGQGGAGGMGGGGTSCYDYATGTSKYLSGGTSGARGMNGAQGMRGSQGAPGPAGRVTIDCAEPG